MWARVARAQKRKGGEMVSDTPNKFIREIPTDPHLMADSDIDEPTTSFLGDDLETGLETQTDERETAVGSTLKEDLSEWACTFGVTHNALDALLKVL